jgi:hypothetical protein
MCSICKLFDYMTANLDNYVTLWQHCITVSAATERASQANSKIFTDGEDNRGLRHIIIKKVPHRMIQFTLLAAHIRASMLSVVLAPEGWTDAAL